MDGGTKDQVDTEREPKKTFEAEPRFALMVPVKFGEDTVTHLEYRKPTAKDIIQNGVPCKINLHSYEVTFDEPKMQSMMASLYAQPPSLLERLDPRDWLTAAWKIAPFFIPDLGKI